MLYSDKPKTRLSAFHLLSKFSSIEGVSKTIRESRGVRPIVNELKNTYKDLIIASCSLIGALINGDSIIIIFR